jgi:hypothetical protein
MFALMGGLEDADVSPAMRIDADSPHPVATGNDFWGGAPAVQGNQLLQEAATKDKFWGASHTDAAQEW